MAIRTRWFDDQIEAALGMPVAGEGGWLSYWEIRKLWHSGGMRVQRNKAAVACSCRGRRQRSLPLVGAAATEASMVHAAASSALPAAQPACLLRCVPPALLPQ